MLNINLEVIVFSRGRENIIQKSLHIWQKQPFRFLVFHNNVRRIQLPDNSPNIEYYHCPNFDYARRSRLASELLSNSYSVILSDDEVLVPTGVQRIVEEMNQNDNLMTVGGRVLGAFRSRRGIIANEAYTSMKDYILNDGNIEDRLRKHFGEMDKGIPVGAMYRVMRKEVMKSLLQTFGEFGNMSSPYVFQAAGEFITTALGDTKYLNEIYWIRNWDIPPISNPSWSRKVTFSDWWSNPNFATERERFLMVLNTLWQGDLAISREVLSAFASRGLAVDKLEKIKLRRFNFYVQRIRKAINLGGFKLRSAYNAQSIEKESLLKLKENRNFEEISSLIQEMILN